MASPDVSAISAAFLQSATIFGKAVLNWKLKEHGVQVRVNVKAPQAMTKLSASGEPAPYAEADNFNDVVFTDRVLTAYQSNYDFKYDPERERNTYLAVQTDAPFSQWAVEQSSKQYLDKITSSTLWLGVRNGAGTTAADICDGWGTIIAAEIVAATLTPVVTGAITSANAVTKVELVADDVPLWMKEAGYVVYVSYDVFTKYAAHYRTLNGFSFKPDANNKYKLDNRNGELRAVSFMGTSQRIVATIENNLVFGTDVENVTVHSTPHLNIMQNRLMMPAGCQIQDLDAMRVNDQA